MANPFLGVLFHWLGGLAAASFYIPYRGVKRWSWETYWLVGGVFSWIVAPFLFAWLLVPDVWAVLLEGYQSSPKGFMWAYIFGVMWGVGGLTFGLTMRYLGIALGVAVALGYCAVFGTLMPPIFDGSIGTVVYDRSGQIILFGVFICLLGIAVTGMAGMSKERELSDEQKKAVIQEFNFLKGILVATFSGIMSAAFAYGLAAGKPIAVVAESVLATQGGNDLWQNLPVLIVVLWGGFTTNFLWCVMLNIKNRSGGEYLAAHTTSQEPHTAAPETADPAVPLADNAIPVDSDNSQTAASTAKAGSRFRVPLATNYLFSALAGVTWYLQFFFYSMGETRMGKYGFSSWTLHMASIIIFSSLWGIALREWKGTSRRTHLLLLIGLAVLIGSTLIVGYGNFLKEAPVATH